MTNMHFYFYFQSLWTQLLKKVTVSLSLSLSYQYHSIGLLEVTHTHTKKKLCMFYLIFLVDFICEVFLLLNNLKTTMFFKSLDSLFCFCFLFTLFRTNRGLLFHLLFNWLNLKTELVNNFAL